MDEAKPNDGEKGKTEVVIGEWKEVRMISKKFMSSLEMI